ncbi:GNAT family N-acetyltransferase [Frigidibacter sp. SD6-1]|uniref:GNAT family N-acetyltransferase n=1 Tax=Frigidibacter sp. SD6-1 TaxID=3032581 RepID=UPI0024DFACF9|nr:GNAT family N-acetyltransferase [Frigidibacter sp. SD6-1]
MITLSPLPADRLSDAAHLEVPPDQQQFVGTLDKLLGDLSSDVGLHAIRADGRVIGLFKTDLAYAERHAFAHPAEPGLRGMLIGGQYQGLGYGKAAMAALPAYLRKALPAAASIALTVNCRNPAARHIYLAGGWVDTGEIYHGGAAGPQHILRLPLM